MDDMINDMVNKGLVSFEPDWIQRAVQQKNPRLSVYLANSKRLPLIQDELSKALGLILPNETSVINWN